MLACPTARAASVLSTSVGLPASTIHRLLEFNPQEKAFRRDKLNPLPADAVVIDEASMLDIHLAARFLEALREECVVLFVGDANQLPSVGPGAVLHDLLGSPRVPRVELSGIFRQDPTGDIARNAALINCGVVPSHWRRATAAQLDGMLEPRPSGCLLVPARSAAEAQRLLCGDVLRWLRGVGYNLQEEVQVLSPVKRGPAGTVQLNQRLKGELNRRSRAAPPDGAAPDAATSDSEADVRVTIGDHVIQLKNDYDSQVFNGDSGIVCAVRPEGRSYSFVVEFDARKGPTPLGEESEPVRVVYPRSALGKTVSLAYALTVHKSQGSEYEVVCMPVLREPPHPYMLFRNLLYTGLSRAKRLLVVVGTEDAIANAVANEKAQARRTMLRQRISNDAFAPPTTRHL